MAKIEETDYLRLQNLSLKVENAKLALDALSLRLNEKYGTPEGLRVTEDGTIVGGGLTSIPPAPLPGAGEGG